MPLKISRPLTKATLIQKFWSDTVTFHSILLVSWLIFMISKCASCQNNELQNTRNTSIRIKSFNIFWSHCDQNKPTNSFRVAGELLGFLGCKLSPFYLPCSVLLVPNRRKGIHSGPWWLIATWTGHTLSSHAFCGSVSQRSASQKKTLHHGAHTAVRSPLIPLLRPRQQLRRLDTRADSRQAA